MRWPCAGALLCVGIYWGNEKQAVVLLRGELWVYFGRIGIILGGLENWMDWMEEVWAPPPRYTRTATLPRSM